ncbi:Ribosomal L7Ae domain containing protein [Trichuris trichiura]|uniref:Ribosomal L7Ae domain containing protein n=1 Tax=Trichuris trichiura TaxID=36087 RepID=A0A077Z0M8_TRITR|nr:Ribosomal L7Ae domain containing protein [Trichuris trichiura]
MWLFALMCIACTALFAEGDVLCPFQGDNNIPGFLLTESNECITISKVITEDKDVDLHKVYGDKCGEFPKGELCNFTTGTEYKQKLRAALINNFKEKIPEMIFLTGLKIHSDKDLSGSARNKSYGSGFGLVRDQKYFITVGRRKYEYTTIESLIDMKEATKFDAQYPGCVYLRYKNTGKLNPYLFSCKISVAQIKIWFPQAGVGVPCKHSTFSNCKEWSGDYCKCKAGYEGKYCDKKVTSCKDNPCQGQSSCTDVMFYYICHCAPDRTGMNCEVEAGPCRSSPCRNGGICLAVTNSVFSCTCKAPYTGDTCESIAKEDAEEKSFSATILFATAFVPSMIIATLISICFIQKSSCFWSILLHFSVLVVADAQLYVASAVCEMADRPSRSKRRRPRMGDPLVASECFEIVTANSLRSRKESRFEVPKEAPRLLKPNPLDSSEPLVCQHKPNRKTKVSGLKKAILKDREALQSESIQSKSKIADLIDNSPSEALDSALKKLLKRLKELHDRAYRKGQTQLGKGKRLVCGLHETKKYVDLNKVKLVVIAQDLEDSLFDIVEALLTSCKQKAIPYVFALSRVTLGRTVYKGRPVAFVAILTYHDAQELYQLVDAEIASSKKAHEEALITSKERGDNSTQPTVVSEVMKKMQSLTVKSAINLVAAICCFLCFIVTIICLR